MDAAEYREEEAAQFAVCEFWYWAWPCEKLDDDQRKEFMQMLGTSEWEEVGEMVYCFSVNEYNMRGFQQTMRKLIAEGTIAEYENVG